jgi:hypothetical protein
MSDLQNQTPANTYKGLLQVGDYTNGVDSTAKYVSDGEGTNSALSLSTTKVGVGTASPSQELEVNGNIVATTLTTSGAVTAGSVVATSGSLNLVGTNTQMFAASNGDDIQFKFSSTKKASINNAGLFSAGDGSKIVPSFRFTDDSDTGMFRPANNEIAFSTASNEAMRIDSDGNCGIGTTSPDSKLEIVDSSNHLNLKVADTVSQSVIRFSDSNGLAGAINYDHNTDKLHFITDGTAIPTNGALNIDSDGNVGVGVTNPSFAFEVKSNSDEAILKGMSPNGLSNFFIKKTNAGDTEFSNSFVSGGAIRDFIFSNGDVTPSINDAQDIGSATKRWDDIYATNQTIQTSDRELKQDIEELTEAEQRVAVACKGLLRKYRWKSSVEEKGDGARIHFGIMAQDLEAAFTAEGLDVGRYGMFIKNTWWEADRVIPAVEAVEAAEAVYDEEGNEVSPAVEAVEAQPEKTERDIFNNIEEAPEGANEVTQRGVRYGELLAFIIAAI